MIMFIITQVVNIFCLFFRNLPVNYLIFSEYIIKVGIIQYIIKRQLPPNAEV